MNKEKDDEVKNIVKTKRNIRIPTKLEVIAIVFLIVILLGLGIKFSASLKHRETVLDFGFKDVGELVTQEWYGRILQDSSKDRKLFKKFSIPFTTSRIIFSLDVEVTAGLDFSKIEYKYSDDGKSVTINLPKTEVYKYYQVPNTFQSYLDDESWFTNIGSKERHDLEDAVVEMGKDTALKAGLLEKADKNARVIIEQMIKAKDKDVKIVWKEK